MGEESERESDVGRDKGRKWENLTKEERGREGKGLKALVYGATVEGCGGRVMIVIN